MTDARSPGGLRVVVVGFEGASLDTSPEALTWGAGALDGGGGAVVNALSGEKVPLDRAMRYVASGDLCLIPNPIELSPDARDVIVLVQNMPCQLGCFYDQLPQGAKATCQVFRVSMGSAPISRIVTAFPSVASFQAHALAVADAFWTKTIEWARVGVAPAEVDPVRNAVLTLVHDHPGANAVDVHAREANPRVEQVTLSILQQKSYEAAGLGDARLATYKRYREQLKTALGEDRG